MEPDTKNRSAVLLKILGGTDEAVAEEPRDAVKDTRPAIPTPMLDLVLRDGRVESFSYAYLTRVSFDPKGRLVLYFGDDTVSIEGRNLGDVRQKVRLHKADEIQEGVEAEGALKPETAAHIERIDIATEKKSQKEAENHDAGHRKGFVR